MEFQKPLRPQLSLVAALAWIVSSTLLISGSAYTGFKAYLAHQRYQEYSVEGQIRAIVQTGPQKEALRTDYLAELIEVSLDRPAPLVFFDCNAAEQKLRASPVIKEAFVKPLPPSTLQIDYVACRPCAWLYDYENAAIDEEGRFFPVYPFFTPPNLPEIFLGLFQNKERVPPFWGTLEKDKHLTLALKVLQLVEGTKISGGFHLKRIDVSEAFASHYGSREIVVIWDDEVGGKSHRRFLRLSTKNYPQELGNYLTLREGLLEKEKGEPSSQKVIDLRLPNLGFIETL